MALSLRLKNGGNIPLTQGHLMSGDWLIVLELLLVFGVAMVWGLNELRQLKRYERKQKDIDEDN